MPQYVSLTMNDLISIIVPVYNTGGYLTRCVESIVNQDYPNIEVILVDDGSTDTVTAEICENLAEQHANVRSLHKTNGGSASARNYGIKHAKGQFIGFVDSDDVIDRQMYSALYGMIIRDKVKVAVCGLSTEENGKATLTDEDISDGIYDHNSLMHHFLLGHWHSACTNLYAKELFDNVEFPENEVNEDYMLNYWIFKTQEKISVVNHPYYHYVRREGSNTASPKSLKFLDWIKHTSLVLEEMSSIPALLLEAEYQYLYSNIILANSCLLTLGRIKSEEADQLYSIVTNNLKKNRKMLFRQKYLSSRYHSMGCIMSLAPSLYKTCVLAVLHVKNKRNS